MNEPIDLNSRRETRTPEPDGEPDIRMPMDSDRIIFRDQAALDEYVAGALATVTDQRDKALAQLERVTALADQWTYKGEFGWGSWQEGEGPDFESQVLDTAATRLRDMLAADSEDE